MMGSILVPLDGSNFGEHALPHAILIARRAHLPIRLVHVYVPMPTTYAAQVPPTPEPRDALETLAWARSYLDGMADSVASRAGVPVTAEVYAGSAVAGVLDAAGRQQDALIVMASHGRGGLARAWLGSVADGVVRAARMPVLIIRPTHVGVDLLTEPKLEHVLVPLDGSRLAEEVLPVARALGEATRARFTLLHLEPRGLDFDEPSAAPGRSAIHESVAQEHLEMRAGLLAPASVDTVVRTTWLTDYAREILREADAVGADVIAMATHGRGAVRRALLGSVADKVVRGSARPVLLYRPRGVAQPVRLAALLERPRATMAL